MLGIIGGNLGSGERNPASLSGNDRKIVECGRVPDHQNVPGTGRRGVHDALFRRVEIVGAAVELIDQRRLPSPQVEIDVSASRHLNCQLITADRNID